MTIALDFCIHQRSGPVIKAISIGATVIAGWTGRDEEALEKHIAELEELGIARPVTTPIFYRVSSSRLSFRQCIEVSGSDSSGEVEFILIAHADQLYVGVGSDHTDRKVEAYGVTVSKQMCDKPLAGTLWPFDEVAEHWDQLELRSWLADGTLYQSGSVTAMRHPQDLISRYSEGGLRNGTLMFCGTLAAIGGIRPTETFRFSLKDPVLDREIAHSYNTIQLPVLG